MGNFRDDLIKGKEAEGIVLEALRKEGFKLIPNPEETQVDLLIISGGIEVKKDEFAQYSGNFYVEFECNGKPSGLFRDEEIELTYWAHTDGIYIYILDASSFKELVLEKVNACRENKSNTSKGFRVVEQGGNGGRTKGLLIPIAEMQKLAKTILDYK